MQLNKLIPIFLFFILFFSCQNNNKKQKKNFDLEVMRKEVADIPIKNRILKYDSILNFTPNLSSLDKAMILFDKAGDLIDLSKSEQAIKIYKQIIPIYKNSNDQVNLAKTYVNLGIAYGGIGKNSEELAYESKALHIGEELNNPLIKSRVYSQLAHIFFKQEDYKKSLDFLEKVVAMQKQQNDSLGFASTYQNMAIIYEKQKDLDNAINYTEKSLDIAKKINHQMLLSYIYNNLGSFFMKKKDYGKAIINLKKAIEINKANGFVIGNEYYNLAIIYKKLGNNNLATKYFQLALNNHSNKLDIKHKLVDELLDISIEQQKIPAIKKYLAIKDSLLLLIQKNKADEQLKLVENNYNLNLEKIKLSLKNKKLEKNIYYFWFGVTILLFLGIISTLLYANKTLRLQKDKLILEQRMLRMQLKPHFIFNSLAALQKTLIFDSQLKAITFVSRFANLLRKNFEFISKGEIFLQDEMELLNDYAEMQKIRIEKDFDLIFDISPDINPKQILLPPLLLQPIIENSIEHGFADKKDKGHILIKIYRKGDLLCFNIKDNGTMKKNKQKPKKDNREHALDILKKRLIFFNKKHKKSLSILPKADGTEVHFCIEYKKNK